MYHWNASYDYGDGYDLFTEIEGGAYCALVAICENSPDEWEARVFHPTTHTSLGEAILPDLDECEAWIAETVLAHKLALLRRRADQRKAA